MAQVALSHGFEDRCSYRLFLAQRPGRHQLSERRRGKSVGDQGSCHEATVSGSQLTDPGQGVRLCADPSHEADCRRGEGRRAGGGRVAGMKLLFIGDIVGSTGRRAFATAFPELEERFSPDLTIINGENAAGGVGITENVAGELFTAGADVITLGNHAFRRREVWDYLDSTDRVIRPANYRHSNPGSGSAVLSAGGLEVGVVNLSGKVGLEVARSPFDEIDLLVEALGDRCDAIVVDFHAEATSEKVAFGWYVDGRVTAVLGTHTHVPTADGRILPGGTAYVSDVGMTGARDGVIGVKRDQAIEKMRTGLPVRFEEATGDPWVMGAAVTIGDAGLAEAIETFQVPA